MENVIFARFHLLRRTVTHSPTRDRGQKNSWELWSVANATPWDRCALFCESMSDDDDVSNSEGTHHLFIDVGDSRWLYAVMQSEALPK